jgi:hypothetical protein
LKIPAFQFYPADWRKDPSIQALSYEHRGIVFETLCILHELPERGRLKLNGKPMSREFYARLLGLDKQILEEALTIILETGALKVDEDGILYSSRMVKDENLRKIRQQSGSRGGNPALLKQNTTKNESECNYQDKQTSEVEDEDVHEDIPSQEGESEGCDPRLIYEAYPRKVGRPVALKAIVKALASEPFDSLLSKTEAFARAVQGKDQQYIAHPSTWFNQQRYNDDPSTWNPEPARRRPEQNQIQEDIKIKIENFE